jgi:hypothetical protein
MLGAEDCGPRDPPNERAWALGCGAEGPRGRVGCVSDGSAGAAGAEPGAGCETE